MRLADFKIHSTKKLDRILGECCSKIFECHRKDPDYWGNVGACIIDSKNRAVYGVNHEVDGGRCHAEVAAIQNYIEKYGKLDPEGAIIVTTLSPCSTDIDQPGGINCVDFLEEHGIKKVYCGWSDPTQDDTDNYHHKKFHVMETRNPKIRELCAKLASTFLSDLD